MSWITYIFLGGLFVTLSYLAWACCWRKRQLSLIALLALVSWHSVCFGMMSWGAFGVGLVGGIVVLAPVRPRRFMLAGCLLTIGFYACVPFLIKGISATRWETVREQYPLESLSPRLSYETLLSHKLVSLPESLEPKIELAQLRLSEVENTLINPFAQARTESLELAHADFVQRFVSAPGFGTGRKIFRPSPSWANRLDRDGIVKMDGIRISLDSPKPDYDLPRGAAPLASTALEDATWKMHSEGLLHFFYPEGFGYVRNRNQVAGFVPHKFRDAPWSTGRDKGEWLLERLELVSLLKYDKPAVYVSGMLPNMADVDQYETRPLDAFETSALPLLQAGEDLTKELKDKQLRLLGSIRATKQCLKCHDAKRGDLLGAFTYKLRQELAPR